jgi:hypothetical protein
MMVYDGDCYKGGIAGIGIGKKDIAYQDYEGDFHVFKKENFDHCKQPLKEWLKKPYKPYD